jgi:hypothetical protein
MAVVQGIREKVHLPIYDSLSVEAGKQLREAEPSSILKFFVDVQKKTKLETNLQSASLLPHYNTFEARSLRVVISDLPPEFSTELVGKDEKVRVVNDSGDPFKVTVGEPPGTEEKEVVANVEASLGFLMERLKEARESGVDAEFLAEDDADNKLKIIFKYSDDGGVVSGPPEAQVRGIGLISLTVFELERIIDGLDKSAPPREQTRPNNGAGTIIGKIIYNTVTTLYVGEKIMIQMPTWFFPAGAGPYSEGGNFTTHGKPSPMATFRFAEPIFIDKQQNFRVEIEIPDTETLKEIQRIYGPMNLWVVLDGYMTRDVQ